MEEQSWLGEWWQFVKAISGPLVVTPGIVGLALIGVAIFFEPQAAGGRAIEATLSLLAMILTGAAGGDAARRWAAFKESGELRVRGENAVRGLNQVFLGSDRLMARLKCFKERVSEEMMQPVDVDNLEELLGLAGSIREGIADAMEQWKDVVPSADLRAQIAERVAQVSRVAELREEIDETKAELAEARESNAEKAAKLEDQLDRLNTLEEKVKEQLRRAEIQRASSGIGGLGLLSGATAIEPSATTIGAVLKSLSENVDHCPECGRPMFGNVCFNCRLGQDQDTD